MRDEIRRNPLKFLIRPDQTCSDVVRYDQKWPEVVILAHTWSGLMGFRRLGQAWSDLALFEHGWSDLVKLGQIGPDLIKRDQI